MNDLVQAVLSGDRRALARLLTHVENEREGVEQALAALFPHTGRAWVIGVTGAPGTGKSSLVNLLAKAYRAEGRTVGIIAVDPTSPFSGGAILGDRIRMRDLAGDGGVFIRSMATRGSLGGLARTTRDAIRVLDAAGFDIILVETVGAGRVRSTSCAPGEPSGRSARPGRRRAGHQAGILEIADVLVVNRPTDRASSTVRSLKAMLELGHPARAQLRASGITGRRWSSRRRAATRTALRIPPIVQTIFSGDARERYSGAGAGHRRARQRQRDGLSAQLERQRIESELYDRLQAALMARFMQSELSRLLGDLIEGIAARRIDPHQAVKDILDRYDP
jgi:LAO/AO transport system kinase